MHYPKEISLFYREDKLMKPIVIHDGFNPTRFFLYLFPEEPKFDPKEVGEPAFLTPYLEKGQNEEARNRAQVVLQDWPKMESYAGFLNVNPEYNSNLYFWFFPSQSKPSSDPVILWLQVSYTIRKLKPIAIYYLNILYDFNILFIWYQTIR